MFRGSIEEGRGGGGGQFLIWCRGCSVHDEVHVSISSERSLAKSVVRTVLVSPCEQAPQPTTFWVFRCRVTKRSHILSAYTPGTK